MPSAIGLQSGVTPDIDSFFDPKSWLDLNPSLSVANLDTARKVDILKPDEALLKSLEGLLLTEGYFHVPQLPWNLPLPGMAQAVGRLVERGLVPPFCFMYDEFWKIFFKLHFVLGRLLGEGYSMLPDFWAWHVDPRAGQSGWKPHRDKDRTTLFPDGRPKSLSVWIPLTEATPLNGCMYVVPADRDPTYNTEKENEWSFIHQDIRALPSAAGGLFMWTQALIHWGSRTSPRAPGPRISLAFEFQRGDVPPMNNPLLPPLAVLTIEQRLALICKQVFQYQHMYPLSPEMKQLAEAVMERVKKK